MYSRVLVLLSRYFQITLRKGGIAVDADLRVGQRVSWAPRKGLGRVVLEKDGLAASIPLLREVKG